MAINKDCFITDIQAEVDNITSSCDKEEFMKTALSSCGVSDNVQSYVATGNDLPDLFFNPIPDGTFFYVDSLGTSVYSSNCKWYGVDGREYRNDIPILELYAWGSNVRGQIGDNTTVSKSSPVQEITSSTEWCQVSGGSRGSLALETSGKLYATGRNDFGQLADGTTICRSSPVQEVTSSTDWCRIHGGRSHTLSLKTSGTLWAWGYNLYGSLGDGTDINFSSPVQEITSSTDWFYASGGLDQSIALKTNDTLWSWGRNDFGELGDGTKIYRSSPVQEVTSSTDWCQVSGGYEQSHGLKKNGTLWSWGGNGDGQLGDGTRISKCSPVQETTSSTDWFQVSGGAAIISFNVIGFSSAIKTSGTLWGWGRNTCGSLGDGTTITRSSPVQEVTSSSDWCQVSNGFDVSLAIKIT